MKSRNTVQQQLIFDILSKAESALSADELLKALPYKINKTTVYRVLDRFKKSGKVHSITGDGGKAFYAISEETDNKSHNHQCDDENHSHEHLHFQCRSCDKIECLPHTVTIPEINDYDVTESQFLLIGTSCPSCA